MTMGGKNSPLNIPRTICNPFGNTQTARKAFHAIPQSVHPLRGPLGKGGTSGSAPIRVESACARKIATGLPTASALVIPLRGPAGSWWVFISEDSPHLASLSNHWSHHHQPWRIVNPMAHVVRTASTWPSRPPRADPPAGQPCGPPHHPSACRGLLLQHPMRSTAGVDQSDPVASSSPRATAAPCTASNSADSAAFRWAVTPGS